MVAKVGVQLLRKLQKQLKNIEEIAKETPAEEKPQLRELYAEVKDRARKVEEEVKTIPEPSLEEKRQQLRGYTSPQRTEVNYYETLLNKLRSKYKSELPLGSGAIAFNDLPKAEQDRLYRGGFAKPGDMITIPSVVEQGKTAKKILGQRLKALEEQEAKDLSEVSPALEKIPVFERTGRFDYETYDPQIGPARRDAFEDRYKVTNPYAPDYGLTFDDPPGTQFIANPLRRTDPKTGKTKILSPRKARLENLESERERVRGSNSLTDKQKKTKLNLIDRQINYHELTQEKNKISLQLRNETNPTKQEGLQKQLNNINNKLEPKPSKGAGSKDMTKLTENQQFSEDKKTTIVLENLTLAQKFAKPRALSSAEPLAKQSDPILLEKDIDQILDARRNQIIKEFEPDPNKPDPQGRLIGMLRDFDEDRSRLKETLKKSKTLPIGSFTKQGREKFRLEGVKTKGEKPEFKGKNIPTDSPYYQDALNQLRLFPRENLYKDPEDAVNIFEGVGRVRRENQFINNLLKNEEEEIGRPLMPDEIEEKFPRIYNEYIKPTAKELEQQEQLTKQLRESAGGTGEAVGEEAGYLPRQVSAFMRGLDDVPEGDTLIDPRGRRTDFDEVYEGKQFEIDPDPEVEGMPQMAPGSFYEDRYATTKLNPEAALIQREDRILNQIDKEIKKLTKNLEKTYRTTGERIRAERIIDEKRADLLERGLAAIRPKRDVRGAAERFFKEPKKQPKKKPASKKLTPAEKNKKIKSVNKRIKELTPLIEKNGPKKYKERINSINKDIVALGIERKALKGSKKKIKTLQEEIKELNKKNVRGNPFKESQKRKEKNSIKKEIKRLKSYSDPPRYKGEFGSDRHPVFKRRGGSLRGQGAALRGF
jgi:hypothetical protein